MKSLARLALHLLALSLKINDVIEECGVKTSYQILHRHGYPHICQMNFEWSQRRDEEDALMAKLTNKVAIVTGASKGIGASIARHLAAEGASVVVDVSSEQIPDSGNADERSGELNQFEIQDFRETK